MLNQLTRSEPLIRGQFIRGGCQILDHGLFFHAQIGVPQLRAHIDSLRNALARKVSEQRAYFEAQLAQLGGYVSKKAPSGAKAVTASIGRSGKRAKAKPKYQSKKKPSVKWSGRGMTPVWMREEMKGTKPKKDDFLIK